MYQLRLPALLVLLLSSCGRPPSPAASARPAEVDSSRSAPAQPRSIEQRLGTHFSDDAARFQRPPRLRRLAFPAIRGANAIWGATGRDDAGRMYFGVSCANVEFPSAHLLELPRGGELKIAGDVLAQLKSNGKFRDGEGQMKIHSKPCQASDGFLYFASMDVQGENENGSQLPTWGGHLWRKKPGDDGSWQHLLTSKEALINVGCTGRHVYALGYFDHVLYRYDTQTREFKSIHVGSYRGHISRNLLVDLREHVFVPRVKEVPAERAGEEAVTKIDEVYVESSLVEFDSELSEVQSWPLPDYEPTYRGDSHGIVGYAALANGDICFTTHTGALWKVAAGGESASALVRLGWFHPQGRSYPACLVCPTGQRHLMGLANMKKRFEWVVYDLETSSGQVLELDAESQELLHRPRLLAYGNNTLDDDSHAYFGGWVKEEDKLLPILLQAEWPQT